MIELLRQRRSVRRFTGEKVSTEDVRVLQEALLRSPSSRGFAPWEFVFVDDPDLLRELARAKPHGAAFLQGAALAIVVCADETKADTWVEDTSIASILVQLIAQDLGLGSCWVQIRLRENGAGGSAEQQVQTLLGIPEQVRVESIIALGHAAEHKGEHPAESLDYAKIHRNRFGA